MENEMTDEEKRVAEYIESLKTNTELVRQYLEESHFQPLRKEREWNEESPN